MIYFRYLINNYLINHGVEGFGHVTYKLVEKEQYYPHGLIFQKDYI